MLILVVEDEATSRDNLTRLMRSQHHEVVAFSNAVETLDYIAKYPVVDVALIDFKLASWPNGISLAKQIRLMYPKIAIVIISAYATNQDVVTAFRQGIDDFVLRPVDSEELLNVVSEAALHRRQALQSDTNHTHGALTIDPDMRRAFWHDVEIKLTPMEFSLLNQLAARPNVAINFPELYSVIYGEHLKPREARNSLKTHLSNLKIKLKAAAPDFPVPIHTAWGHGAYWNADDGSDID